MSFLGLSNLHPFWGTPVTGPRSLPWGVPQSQVGGTPGAWGTPQPGPVAYSLARTGWGIPSQVRMGYPLSQDGVPSPADQDGLPPAQFMLGQLMLRAVRILRFLAGGLSCKVIVFCSPFKFCMSRLTRADSEGPGSPVEWGHSCHLHVAIYVVERWSLITNPGLTNICQLAMQKAKITNVFCPLYENWDHNSHNIVTFIFQI